MTVTLLPDAEALTWAFLTDQDEVTDLVDDRVCSVLPKRNIDSGSDSDPDLWPIVRVQRVGGAPVTNRPLWLDEPFMQSDVWGGSKVDAWIAAETVRAVLAERFEGTVTYADTSAVVQSVTFAELLWLPDDHWTPARPRFSFSFSFTTHP